MNEIHYSELTNQMHCNVTGKTAYLYEAEARAAGNRRHQRLHGVPELRAYQCGCCGHWHLTKKQQRRNPPRPR